MRQHFYKNNMRFVDKIFAIDYFLVFLVLILGVISIFSMYSTEGGSFGYYTQSHIYRLVTFFLFFLFFSFLNINFLHKISYIFYFSILILLLGVHFYGIASSGSKRWISLIIFNLQPSEMMKVGIIIFLARYYNKIPANDVNKIKFLILPIFILFIPLSLVAAQPDLGTALLITMTGISVIFLAGFRLKYFFYSFIALICLAPVGISFLKPYQKARILTFLSPENDPLGAGYQIIQSKIAVGSGGIFGKGFLKGSQNYLDYLPEKHTDFIFTLFSEQFGFIGSTILLIIYALIIYRIIRIGMQTKNNFSRLFCFGFATSFFIFVTVNMSMVLGLLPIVGAPLPIMSYGGSSLLSMLSGLGIVMSCKIHEREQIN